MPIDPSSMVRWRKRIGEAGAEDLLKQTIESGLKIKAIKGHQLKRVNVDTTVQEKAIRYPTDARLYHEAREKLVKEAKGLGIKLRQSYTRKSKEMLFKQGRYRHVRQMRRADRCVRKLRTYLGRVLRDMRRKVPHPSEELQELFHLSHRIYQQKRNDKDKGYSLHVPEVSCISKGKAHKRYEFGCKVSIAVTSQGGWLMGAKAFHGNPYDGHTLREALEQVERRSPKKAEPVFCDKGYRGHNDAGEAEVHVDKTRRGRTPEEFMEMDEAPGGHRADHWPSKGRPSIEEEPSQGRSGRRVQRRVECGGDERLQVTEVPQGNLFFAPFSVSSLFIPIFVSNPPIVISPDHNGIKRVFQRGLNKVFFTLILIIVFLSITLIIVIRSYKNDYSKSIKKICKRRVISSGRHNG